MMSIFPAKELTFTWPRIRVPDRPRRSEDPGRVRAVRVCVADSRLGRVRHLSYPSNERSGRSGRPYPRRSCSLRPARQPLCVRRCRSAGRAAALPSLARSPQRPSTWRRGCSRPQPGQGAGQGAGRSVRLVVCVLPGQPTAERRPGGCEAPRGRGGRRSGRLNDLPPGSEQRPAVRPGDTVHGS